MRNEDKRCDTKYCLGTPLKGRNKCQKCRLRNFRYNNPIRASYLIKKWNAHKEGIPFLISFEEWKEFCRLTNYHIERGQEAWSATVDRIVNSIGYVMGNIQKLTREANIKKKKKDKGWSVPNAGKQPGDPF